MSKFTFINEDDNVSIWHDVNSVLLSEIISQFQNFLRGCGFHFDGYLDIVKDDVNIVQSEPEEKNEPKKVDFNSTFHVI